MYEAPSSISSTEKEKKKKKLEKKDSPKFHYQLMMFVEIGMFAVV